VRSSAIRFVEYELGSETLSFEQLEERFGADAMRKVFAGSGIRHRRVAPRGVCGSDLAYAAATRLLDNHAVDRSTIDLVIHCTQTPDYLLPTTACLLQQRLGLPTRCAAFDLNLGCSQYVYALSVAHSMIAAGVANRALVLTGDTMTHTIHPMDRSLVPLMGDAGSATLIDAVDNGGFMGFELGTDGSGGQYLCIPASGSRQPRTAETAVEVTDAEGNTRSAEHFFMNGAAVFHFAVSTAPKAVQNLLSKLNLTMDDVGCILFHQANKFMLDYLVKKLKIPAGKTHFYIEDTGNTSGSTVPGVLSDAIRIGRIQPGAIVVLVAFGVGLSWAATAMRWPAEGSS